MVNLRELDTFWMPCWHASDLQRQGCFWCLTLCLEDETSSHRRFACGQRPSKLVRPRGSFSGQGGCTLLGILRIRDCVSLRFDLWQITSTLNLMFAIRCLVCSRAVNLIGAFTFHSFSFRPRRSRGVGDAQRSWRFMPITISCSEADGRRQRPWKMGGRFF